MKTFILFPRVYPLLLIIALLLAALNSCDNDDDTAPLPPAPENINPGPCDSGLELSSTDATEAAKALDICALEGIDGSSFGLVEASFSRFGGGGEYNPLQVGISNAFGSMNTPSAGEAMLVLSTGRARTPAQPGACGSFGCAVSDLGTAPSGYPLDVPGCAPAGDIYDDVCLKLTLKAPAGAMGFSIDYSLFTFDYPNFICGGFNDQFVIVMEPAVEGALSGNVAFDALERPIGANSNFVDPDLDVLLPGTGFGAGQWGDAGTTGWLRTSVPVTGGIEFSLRIAIYDVGDQVLDSTVLLDNFKWLSETPVLQTVAL